MRLKEVNYSKCNSKIKSKGYFLIKNFFSKQKIDLIKSEIKRVFILSLKHNIHKTIGNISTDKVIEKLYNLNEESFWGCTKVLQMMPEIYNISSDPKIIALLKGLGLKSPKISYTPLVMFNAPHLLGDKYVTKPHQDWRSMQGSLDSMVLWTPLQDVYEGFGNIDFIPGSHLNGLYKTRENSWFREIDDSKIKEQKYKTIKISKGDLLVFSSFLVHKTGVNKEKKIRWSLQFRYNNSDEESYVKRDFFSPYQNKPIMNLHTKNFPSKSLISSVIKKLKVD